MGFKKSRDTSPLARELEHAQRQASRGSQAPDKTVNFSLEQTGLVSPMNSSPRDAQGSGTIDPNGVV